jgi:hypothetical protein
MTQETAVGFAAPEGGYGPGGDAEHWRARALQAQQRLDERRILDEQIAEIRRRGTERLQEALTAMQNERDTWRARAEAAESGIVAEFLDELKRKLTTLDSERDDWRRARERNEEPLPRRLRGNWLR